MGTTVVVGVFGLASTILGALISYLATARAGKRDQLASVLDDIAGLHNVIWANTSYSETSIQLARIGFRLRLLKVAEALIVELRESALECWRDVNADMTSGLPTEYVGLSGPLLVRYEAAERAVADAVTR